jgi:hypothetical protein
VGGTYDEGGEGFACTCESLTALLATIAGGALQRCYQQTLLENRRVSVRRGLTETSVPSFAEGRRERGRDQ